METSVVSLEKQCAGFAFFGSLLADSGGMTRNKEERKVGRTFNKGLRSSHCTFMVSSINFF